MVTLYNSGTDDFEVKVGDRIAQLIVQEFAQARFIRVEKLHDTDRSDSGFGSTGSR
jgi:dUTP pyrophosphatase